MNGEDGGTNSNNARHRTQNGEKIENERVDVAVHRRSRRCFCVGLAVASVGIAVAGDGLAQRERWYSGVLRAPTLVRREYKLHKRWFSGILLVATELNRSEHHLNIMTRNKRKAAEGKAADSKK